jgi:hypothetical protein
MSITIQVPDGRIVELPTDDLEVAKKAAANWAVQNPAPEIDRTAPAAQLGEEDVSTLGDIAKGVPAGLIGTLQGLVSFPAELIDYATLDKGEVSAAETVRDFFEPITPTTKTTAGNAVKFMTQFIVPGTLASKAAAARNLGKIGQTAAFGAADVLATTPDVETLGDFFETGPTQRIDTENLEGADLASANLINRFKVASEGTALLLGGPAVIKAAAKGFGSASEAVAKTDMAQAAAEGIRSKILDNVGVKPDLENPTFLSRNIQKTKDKIGKYFRFRGELPDDLVQKLRFEKIALVAANNKKARNSIEELNAGLETLNKNGLLNDVDQAVLLDALNNYIFPAQKGKVSRDLIQNQAEDILKSADGLFKQTKKDPLSRLLGKGEKGIFGQDRELSLFQSAKNIRNDIDSLSKNIKDDLAEDGIDSDMNKALIETIEDNMGFYGRTVYRSTTDPYFNPIKNPDGSIDAVKQQKFNKAIDTVLANGMAKDEQGARIVLDEILQRTRSFSNADMKPKNMYESDTLDGISTGILKGKSLDSLPAIRDFLGEYTGAKNIYGVVGRTKQADGTFKPEFGKIRQQTLDEQKIGLQYRVSETVSKMTNLIEQTRYYNNLRAYSDQLTPDKRFIFDRPPPNFLPGDWQRIGTINKNTNAPTEASVMSYGSLAGKWVKTEHARALTDIPQYIKLADASKLYATFLGVKGMSQIAKTVYSPVTQIRNATTAALFAVKNGNFGNGEDLVNSAKVVFQNINDNMAFKKGQQQFGGSQAKIATKEQIKDYYNEMIKLGVVNTNAKIGEFEDLLGDAAKHYGSGLAKKGLQIAQNTQNRFSGKLYQGSDDVWKIYSYEMELGRLRKAFENSIKNNQSFIVRATDSQNVLRYGDKAVDLRTLDQETAFQFLKRESAEIVKDTVPNYARVPEAIKQLRQLPFGNFIAFPAEIIRTSMNLYGRSIKELASESPEMRAIGMRRLMGGITVDAVMPASLVTAGLTLTGSDREQLNAYRRSMAQDWDRYSVLIPISTDKNGNIREFYNFSYTNPYDYLTRPARALYDAVNNGITSEKDLTDIALSSSWESLKEFASPFMDESIITEKMFDLTRNQTRYDRSIWLEKDPLGLKISKGFAHLIDGITPGISPIKLKADVSGQDIQLGDFTLGADLTDFPRAVGLATGLDPITGVNRQGVRVDAAGEFAEALSGLKSIKPRVETVLMYRGYEAGDQVREVSGIFNRIAKSKSKMSPEDITKAYVVANEQRFKALRDLNMAIEDARTLGFSDTEIRRSLKKAKTPSLNMLMAGKFKPFYPSTETIRLALEENDNKLSNPFDFGALGKIRREQYGRSFLPQKEAEDRAERVQILKEQMEQQAQPQAPQTPQMQPQPPGQTPSAPTAGASALRQVELNKLLGID